MLGMTQVERNGGACRSWCGITATATATAILPAQYRKGWHTKGDRRHAKFETGVKKKKAVCVAKMFVYFLLV